MAGEDTHAPHDPTVFFISLVVAATVIVLVWLIRRSNDQSSDAPDKNTQKKRPATSKQTNQKPSKKKQAPWQKSAPAVQFSHPELLTTLKGHSGVLTGGAFSSNGKYFISTADDRTIHIWSTKDFVNRDHRSVRVNIEFDHATKVCWSPDGKAFIVHKAAANCMEVFKVTRKSDGSMAGAQMALTFPQEDKEADVIAMDVALSGKFIMTCNNKNQLTIWSLKGEIMETLDTRHGETYSATLSPCGRFVATTGFTPDVKVWEVKFSKMGSYDGVKRAYDLTGHRAGIYSCAINNDSTRMVSVSKDGTWRLYDTNIEYDKGQLVYLLHTAPIESKDYPALVRLTPDGRTIVVALGSSLTFYSAITAEKLNTISDIYTGDIVDVRFDPDNKQVVTLGEKHIRIFYNVAGYMATIQDFEHSLKKATNAGMKERLKQQIKDANKALETIKKVTKKEK